jgi:hypothetical protein
VKDSSIAFLRTELSTGLTFTRVAQSATRAGKRERNRCNARKAYDSVLHFLPTARLTADEAQEVQSRLEELRFQLKSLGEEL